MDVYNRLRQFSICIDASLRCIAGFNRATATMVSSYVFGYAYMLVQATAIVFTYIGGSLNPMCGLDGGAAFPNLFLQEEELVSAIGSKGGMKSWYNTVCTDVLM